MVVAMLALRPLPSSSEASDDGIFREPKICHASKCPLRGQTTSLRDIVPH